MHHPIYLFRHGETVWNAEKRAQGHLDSPLTEAGRGRDDGWPVNDLARVLTIAVTENVVAAVTENEEAEKPWLNQQLYRSLATELLASPQLLSAAAPAPRRDT